MFRKDLIDEMTKRIDGLSEEMVKFKSRIEKLEEAAYFEYYSHFGVFYFESKTIPASKAIEKILDHLKLEFECEPAKEAECSLVSTVPKKPKKKAKKKK